MNIAYFGSPTLSKLLLDDLINKDIPIRLIVTQPDKTAGKHLKMTPTAVKSSAISHGIKLFDKPLTQENENELIKTMSSNKIELGILFAYGEILSTKLLESMKFGMWNVHPSLLPKYRGPAPIIFPLILGETRTGTTLMQMNRGLDEGNIIQQTTIPIEVEANREYIEQKLVEIAGKQIVNALSLLKTDSLQSEQQDARFATYTKLLKRKDGFISRRFISQALKNEKVTFDDLPQLIKGYYEKNNLQPQHRYEAGVVLYKLYQGLHPWPGIWTLVTIDNKEKRLKLLDIKLKKNILQIQSVQVEGKNPTDFTTTIKAYSLIF